MFLWLVVMALVSGGCRPRCVGAWCWADGWCGEVIVDWLLSTNSQQACFGGRDCVCCWLVGVVCVSRVSCVLWVQLRCSRALARVDCKQPGSNRQVWSGRRAGAHPARARYHAHAHSHPHPVSLPSIIPPPPHVLRMSISRRRSQHWHWCHNCKPWVEFRHQLSRQDESTTRWAMLWRATTSLTMSRRILLACVLARVLALVRVAPS